MRSRNIKPGFFKNEQLGACKPLARLLFQGLWCLADKHGYQEYRPLRIKIEVLPYDSCNVEELLEQLWNEGLIIYYVDIRTEKKVFIYIPTFLDHQSPHYNEKSHNIKELLSNPEFSGNYMKVIPPIMNDDIMNHDVMNNESGVCTEPDTPVAVPAVCEIPLKSKNGAFHQIYQHDVDEWKKMYPAIDILRCLLKIKEWNADNQARRKTEKGIRRHISSWLEREQNKGPRSAFFLTFSSPAGHPTKKEKVHPGKQTCKDCEFFEKICREKGHATAESRICSVGDRFSPKGETTC